MTRYVISKKLRGDWWDRGIIPASSPAEAIATFRRYTGTRSKTPCRARKHVVTKS